MTGAVMRELVEVGPVEELRGVRFVELRFNPFRYDPDRRRLVVSEWVEAEVAFEGIPFDNSRPEPMDGLVAGMLLNGDQAIACKPERTDAGSGFFGRSTFWVKLQVRVTGIHVVTGQDLLDAGMPLAGIEPRSLALYTLGSHEVNGPYPDSMRPVPLFVDDDDDGRFDAGDRILFYGVG